MSLSSICVYICTYICMDLQEDAIPELWGLCIYSCVEPSGLCCDPGGQGADCGNVAERVQIHSYWGLRSQKPSHQGQSRACGETPCGYPYTWVVSIFSNEVLYGLVGVGTQHAVVGRAIRKVSKNPRTLIYSPKRLGFLLQAHPQTYPLICQILNTDK